MIRDEIHLPPGWHVRVEQDERGHPVGAAYWDGEKWKQLTTNVNGDTITWAKPHDWQPGGTIIIGREESE